MCSLLSGPDADRAMPGLEDSEFRIVREVVDLLAQLRKPEAQQPVRAAPYPAW